MTQTPICLCGWLAVWPETRYPTLCNHAEYLTCEMGFVEDARCWVRHRVCAQLMVNTLPYCHDSRRLSSQAGGMVVSKARGAEIPDPLWKSGHPSPPLRSSPKPSASPVAGTVGRPCWRHSTRAPLSGGLQGTLSLDRLHCNLPGSPWLSFLPPVSLPVRKDLGFAALKGHCLVSTLLTEPHEPPPSHFLVESSGVRQNTVHELCLPLEGPLSRLVARQPQAAGG